MKTLKLILIIIITFPFISFIPLSKTENDKKLVGIWKGFEIDKQIEGVEKHWIVQRFSNGKYVIMFTAKQDCEINTFTEKGKWWTNGNVFYEKSDTSDTTDSYNYKITDDLVIHFKSLTTDYEFDDYKLD